MKRIPTDLISIVSDSYDEAIVTSVRGRCVAKIKLVLRGDLLRRIFGLGLLFEDSVYDLITHLFEEVEFDLRFPVTIHIYASYPDLS